ncbi:hypothetical protein MMC25_004351 [Agyrium rufum]|nr:hypothetical protein [Agyrium rufum]
MNGDDPFLQVQADVLSTLESTRPLFTSYLRIRSLASSPKSHELKQARADLEANLQDLTADLADLVESVRAVEQDPFRYGLDVPEVSRRRRLVQDVGAEVESMHEELAKVTTTAQNGSGKGVYTNGGLPPPEAFAAGDEEGDEYAAFEQQRQTEIMHEQDEALDGVFRTVENLRGQAETMGQELEEQGEMLQEVDTLTDRVGDKLKGGTKKLGEIIRKNEGEVSTGLTSIPSDGLIRRVLIVDILPDTMSTCCIGVLIVVLIILLILVIAL